MVPELADYHQLALLRRIARENRISDNEAKQLPYDQFMQDVAFLHHSARWQYEVNAVVNQPTAK